MVTFTAEQRSELRDAAARSRVEAHAEHQRIARAAQERRAAERAEARRLNPPKPRRSRARRPVEVLPPKTAAFDPPPTPAERDLADQLAAHICRDSVIDRDRHALGVARLILNGRRLAGRQPSEGGTR